MKIQNKKTFIFLFALVFIITMFSSCYDMRDVDNMAYAIAIGFDKGGTNALRMTLEFAVPTKSSAGGGGDSESSGGDGKTASITTIEAPTFYAALNMVNTYVSKEINFSHAKIIVFSEELAKENIYKYINAIVRNKEFRGSMHVAIASGNAEDYIRNVTPSLELNTAKYYELNMESYKYTGFTADTRLYDFHLDMESTDRQAYATLVGVNRYNNTEEFDNSNSDYAEKGRDYPLEGDFTAGNLPKKYEIKSEIMGLGIFRGEKMVGVLDGEDAIYNLMLDGFYNHSFISIPDANKKGDYILLDVKKSRAPVIKAELVDGIPKISARVRLEADILSIQSGINYEDLKKMPELEKMSEDFLKKGMMRFLEKTKKAGSDIVGFGRSLRVKYLLWDDWIKVDWNNIYKYAVFSDIEVEVKIRRPGLIIKTANNYVPEG